MTLVCSTFKCRALLCRPYSFHTCVINAPTPRRNVILQAPTSSFSCVYAAFSQSRSALYPLHLRFTVAASGGRWAVAGCTGSRRPGLRACPLPRGGRRPSRRAAPAALDAGNRVYLKQVTATSRGRRYLRRRSPITAPPLSQRSSRMQLFFKWPQPAVEAAVPAARPCPGPTGRRRRRPIRQPTCPRGCLRRLTYSAYRVTSK